MIINGMIAYDGTERATDQSQSQSLGSEVVQNVRIVRNSNNDNSNQQPTNIAVAELGRY